MDFKFFIGATIAAVVAIPAARTAIKHEREARRIVVGVLVLLALLFAAGASGEFGTHT